MTRLEGCQIPGYQRIQEGNVNDGSRSPIMRFKRTFARPWNYFIKPRFRRILKGIFHLQQKIRKSNHSSPATASVTTTAHLKAGDQVWVRSRNEIEATLDPFKELRGCAFLEYMWQYCDTNQRVLKPVERFLDERDYQVKKAKGMVLLEGVLCDGTPVFGRCDRSCHLFWREEWLQKISTAEDEIR
jgi:hypothetical protein